MNTQQEYKEVMLTFRVTASLKKKLNDHALRKGKERSEFIRNLIISEIEKENKA